MSDDLNPLLNWITSRFQVSAHEISNLSNLFKRIELRSGDYLVREGDDTLPICFISSGLLKSAYFDDQGNEAVVDFFWEKEVVSNYAEAITGKAAELSLQSIEDSVLYVADCHKFRGLFLNDSCWEGVGRLLAEKYYVRLFNRNKILFRADAISKYQFFLDNYAPIIGRVRDYEIASYLDLNPSTLSRMLKKIKE